MENYLGNSISFKLIAKLEKRNKTKQSETRRVETRRVKPRQDTTTRNGKARRETKFIPSKKFKRTKTRSHLAQLVSLHSEIPRRDADA